MGTQHTILVVEDNDFVRMQIVSFLKEAGYITLEATDGEVALDLMSKDISLAVVDVRMAPMDGFEFITMAQLQRFKTPVVLATGDQDNTMLERANKLGVATVLMKPIQKERLISMVKRLIE